MDLFPCCAVRKRACRCMLSTNQHGETTFRPSPRAPTPSNFTALCPPCGRRNLQVEQLRNPQLQGKAVALQQHTDIIAMNAAAKAAGVVKHGGVEETRRRLASVGGRLAHVYMDEHYRISYKPYREMSERFLKLLETIEGAAIVERASIDEAYILAHPLGQGPESGISLPLSFGEALGHTIRRRVLNNLQLTVTVGVARNRFLAKLASGSAKPDGLRCLDSLEAVAALLRATPLSRITGFGGKVAAALQQHGLKCAADIQQLSTDALQQICGLSTSAAQRLHGLSFGQDDSAVKATEPPRTISLQMTLTPKAIPVHPSWKEHAVAGGGSKDGMLQPLLIHAPDAQERIKALVGYMMNDLVARIVYDSEEFGRWPTSFTLHVATHGTGAQQLHRAARFPPRYSSAVSSRPSPISRSGPQASPSDQATMGNGQESGQVAAAESKQQDELLQQLNSSACLMFQGLATSAKANLPVVKVQIGCSKFGPIAAATLGKVDDYFARVKDSSGLLPKPSPHTANLQPQEDGAKVVQEQSSNAPRATEGEHQGHRGPELLTPSHTLAPTTAAPQSKPLAPFAKARTLPKIPLSDRNVALKCPIAVPKPLVEGAGAGCGPMSAATKSGSSEAQQVMEADVAHVLLALQNEGDHSSKRKLRTLVQALLFAEVEQSSVKKPRTQVDPG